MRLNRTSALLFGSFLLSSVLAATMTLADDVVSAHSRLIGVISYEYVGHLDKRDEEGRRLVWEASVEGDLAGEMKWWFVDPAPVSPITYDGGEVTFYAARWELWKGDMLVLAGESAGKTVFPEDSDGMWDGHGVVTEANGRFSGLKGRNIYETGPVILGSTPPTSLSGTGMFQVQ